MAAPSHEQSEFKIWLNTKKASKITFSQFCKQAVPGITTEGYSWTHFQSRPTKGLKLQLYEALNLYRINEKRQAPGATIEQASLGDSQATSVLPSGTPPSDTQESPSTPIVEAPQPIRLLRENVLVKILTWNVKYLGFSDSESSLNEVAAILRDGADVILLQEIYSSQNGARRIQDLVKAMGSDFDYVLGKNAREGKIHRSLLNVVIYRKPWILQEECSLRNFEHPPVTCLLLHPSMGLQLSVTSCHLSPTVRPGDAEAPGRTKASTSQLFSEFLRLVDAVSHINVAWGASDSSKTLVVVAGDFNQNLKADEGNYAVIQPANIGTSISGKSLDAFVLPRFNSDCYTWNYTDYLTEFEHLKTDHKPLLLKIGGAKKCPFKPV